MAADRTAHLSDSLLVAYLDGELSWWRRLQVGRHLKRCWTCRARLNQHEQQILRLVEQVNSSDYPGPLWHLEQSLELGRRLRHFETMKELQSPERISKQRLACIVGALAGGMMVIWLLTPATPPRPLPAAAIRPAETVADARNFEQALYQRPVEQTLAVQVEHLAPARRTDVSQLQIWSDAEKGRFASRWTAQDGSLREALWRPAPGREYLLRPHVSQAVLRSPGHDTPSDRISDFLAPQAMDDLEGAFMRWMEERSWAPVSFSPEAQEWMSSHGDARAEAVRLPDGTRQIRLTVQRRINGAKANLTIDFDAESFQPRSMSIHWESAGRVAELRMVSKAVRRTQASEIAAAFVPPEISPLPVRTASIPRLEPVHPATLPVSIAPVESAEQIADAEYALHVAGACLGEPVQVEETASGVRVRGFSGGPVAIASVAKLADVLDALADLRQAPAAAAGSAHARALQLLAQRFSPSVVSTLPAHSRDLLLSMVKEHVEAIRKELGKPVGAASDPAPEDVMPADWRDSAFHLFAALSGTSGQALPEAGVHRLLGLLVEQLAAETRSDTVHKALAPAVGK